MLTTVQYATAVEFLRAAGATLSRHEVANNLILGVPTTVRDHPDDEKAENLYFTVMRDGMLVGALVRTPPHNLIVHVEPETPETEEVIAALVESALLLCSEAPGLVGRMPEIDAFAARWVAKGGRATRQRVDERVFVLSAVVWPRPAPGRLRPATIADMEVVATWFLAFIREAMPKGEAPDTAEHSRRAIEQERLFLWEVSQGEGWRPVCMVGVSRALGKGRTVGPVYTPPAERGKGFASNATAAVSQRLLDDGWAYATLFTDLSNPTSNKIYQQIGYMPICDYAMLLFK